MTLMRILRLVSFLEGVSYLVLLLIAMPLKYVFHQEMAVKITGALHGGLFIALAGITLLAMLVAKLPFKTGLLLGLASIVPAGTFLADRLLKKHGQTLT
jgi:integral membrane protein